MDKSNFLKIAGQVRAPQFIVDWLDRFYEPDEMALLVADGPFNEADLESADRLLRRGVMAKGDDGSFFPANFHVRYDIWALFEGFKDLPAEIRDQLNRWELDDYIQRHKKNAVILKAGKRPAEDQIIPRYLLLDDAFAVVDEAEQVFLWPCNCRSMINGCSKPVYTCVRFSNEQGQGFEISKEKAKEVIAHANQKGLMQTGELGRDENGRLKGAVCNCCTDCCFPHLMAKEIKAEKLWPFSQFQAVFKEYLCNKCGLCARRCPFDAFIQETKKNVPVFDVQRCRGCGLCVETCPAGAIEMERIKTL